MKIANRVRMLLMSAGGATVMLACVLFVLFSILSRRQAAVDDLAGLAAVTAGNCQAALLFGIPEDAQAVLSALAAREGIAMAAIYDRYGTLFAAYIEPGAGIAPPDAPEEGNTQAFRPDGLRVFRRVQLAGKGDVVGTVCLHDDLSRLREALRRDLLILTGVLFASIAVALAVASGLQRLVSRPIVALTNCARAVTEKGDYAVRADVRRRDELGLLADAFNTMLATIQARDAELRSANAALVQEVAQRRRAETALRVHQERLDELVRRRTAALERSNRELEQFAYVASHDLQEPLRKIVAFGDRLRARCADALSEQGRDYVERMQSAAMRMSALVSDLLALSRIATRAAPPAEVDLGEILREVLSDLEVRLQATGAEVDAGPLPVLRADRTQMRQLLQNLVGNALKFHHPDRPPLVRVTAAPARAPDGAVAWRIEVADNGIGFDPASAERIFGVFQRLHTRETYPGTGIGLAVCRKIAERHGGSISATARPGEGATFTVLLPAVPPAQLDGPDPGAAGLSGSPDTPNQPNPDCAPA